MRTATTYRGQRSNDYICDVWVIEDRTILLTAEAIHESAVRELPLRLDLYVHSPEGFEWGFGGPGPDQLALALLADALGNDELAYAHHRQFKRQVVSGFGECWSITAEEIREFIERQPKGESGNSR